MHVVWGILKKILKEHGTGNGLSRDAGGFIYEKGDRGGYPHTFGPLCSSDDSDRGDTFWDCPGTPSPPSFI